jgi:hypothetical protein
MVAFIDAHRKEYGVEPICAELPIAPSMYYESKARESDPARLPTRARGDLERQPQISCVWHENFCVYRARKTWKQLNRERIVVAKRTVEQADGPAGRSAWQGIQDNEAGSGCASTAGSG